MPHKTSASERMRRLHGLGPGNPPWFAPGPGLNPDTALSFTQQRMFTNWDAYLKYLDWRERCREPLPEREVTAPGNSVTDQAG